MKGDCKRCEGKGYYRGLLVPIKVKCEKCMGTGCNQEVQPIKFNDNYDYSGFMAIDYGMKTIRDLDGKPRHRYNWQSRIGGVSMDFSIKSLSKCTILKEIVKCSQLKDEELRFIRLTIKQKHLLEAELHQGLDSIQGGELMGVKIEVDDE